MLIRVNISNKMMKTSKVTHLFFCVALTLGLVAFSSCGEAPPLDTDKSSTTNTDEESATTSEGDQNSDEETEELGGESTDDEGGKTSAEDDGDQESVDTGETDSEDPEELSEGATALAPCVLELFEDAIYYCEIYPENVEAATIDPIEQKPPGCGAPCPKDMKCTQECEN